MSALASEQPKQAWLFAKEEEQWRGWLINYKTKNRNERNSFRRGGETGIWTPVPLLTVTRFPIVRLQPLSHLSIWWSSRYYRPTNIQRHGAMKTAHLSYTKKTKKASPPGHFLANFSQMGEPRLSVQLRGGCGKNHKISFVKELVLCKDKSELWIKK